MVKTSTSPNSVNFSSPVPAEQAVEQANDQDEMFYNNIKPQLDQLIKDPSNETIEKILAYAKTK
ncbi:hypothetical protein WG904_09010 [Pedobacter sp. Du54]|uniref:hypothetical protein n=1 Tax=Pedobacter anseongensis TaxID=3133439 RepID=UPI0030A6B0CF